jgi:sugar phosphate permease
MEQEIEKRTLRRIWWRIVPFIMLLYFIAYIDRVNIGFASLQMKGDLGFSASILGFGAGIFFWGYFIFEVPSNIILHKVGARIWITRVMLTWGIISGLMAFVQGTTSFYVMRFLLGAAEAGFFTSAIGSLPATALASLRSSWRLHRFRPLWDRRFLRHCWKWTASWACMAGSGCSFWRRFPPSSSALWSSFI